jgi:hypothetical protein
MPKRIVFGLAALVAACGPVHEQLRPQAPGIAKLERLDVHVARPGKFTVFEKRLDSNAMEGAMFGLVGHAIAAGADASSDHQTARLVAARIQGDLSCNSLLEAAFLGALERSGRIRARLVEKVQEPPGADSDATLVLTIDHCGFRMMNQSSGEMGAFVEVGVKLTLADGTTGWEDRETFLEGAHATAERLKTEDGLAGPLFHKVLTDAGKRLAYNLLYP